MTFAPWNLYDPTPEDGWYRWRCLMRRYLVSASHGIAERGAFPHVDVADLDGVTWDAPPRWTGGVYPPTHPVVWFPERASAADALAVGPPVRVYKLPAEYRSDELETPAWIMLRTGNLRTWETAVDVTTLVVSGKRVTWEAWSDTPGTLGAELYARVIASTLEPVVSRDGGYGGFPHWYHLQPIGAAIVRDLEAPTGFRNQPLLGWTRRPPACVGAAHVTDLRRYLEGPMLSRGLPAPGSGSWPPTVDRYEP